MGDSLEAVLRFIGGASLGIGLLISIAKLWSILNRGGAAAKNGEARKQDRESFKQINESLMAENRRLREDLATVEERRDYYRTRAHDLGNQVFEIAEQLADCMADLERSRRKPDNTLEA